MDDFKQIVIMGVRCHGDQNLPEHRKKMQQYLMSVGLGDMIPSTLPDFEVQAQQKYVVPLARDQKLTFEYVKMDPRQLADEIAEQGVLWEHFDGFFRNMRVKKRQLSDWHMALMLAAGHINGVVTSDDGTVSDI